MISEGRPLQIEDLDVTMRFVTFTDPIAAVYAKYRGRVSRRRFNNILKMRRKHNPLKSWKDILNEAQKT